MKLSRSQSVPLAQRDYKTKYKEAKKQVHAWRDQCSMLKAAYETERSKRERLENRFGGSHKSF